MSQTEKKENIFKRFKRSIYQGTINPKDENARIRLAFQSFILHLHPAKIDERAIKFNLTFGLGGMAALLICLQFATGILLRFFYQPFPGKAYDSIVYLQNEVLFGQLIRNLHYWSGIFLIVIVFLHLLRTFFTGAIHGSRQFNWVLGVFLLLFVVFSNFTGYLLPWDQLSFWAVTVATSMLEYIPFIGTNIMEMVRGGNDVGINTLLIFYNFHTGILPILLIIIMSFHFWRVRKAGGVVFPKEENNESKIVTTIPHLVAKEFVVALVLLAILFLFSLFFDAPLLDKANPDFSLNPAKAPWYFMGIQEMVLHFHPLIGAILIPLVILFLLIFLPYFKYDDENGGKWFYSEKGVLLLKVSATVGAVYSVTVILLSEYVLDFTTWFRGIPQIVSNGLIPLLITIGFIFGFYKLINKKYSPNKNEIVQALFTLIFMMFIVLTITGIFFRGPGMALGF